MKIPSHFFLALAALGVVVGLLVFWTGSTTSAPTNAEIASLAEAGQIDAAEEKIGLLLNQSPNDPGANLLASQLKTSRFEQVTTSGIGSDPKPALDALELIQRVNSPDPSLQALTKLCQGKAERYLGRLDASEEAWLEALRLNPTVPEAGWLLLQEYYLQGRSHEASELALRLHQTEPDPGDRLRLLFEPLRQDVKPPDTASLVLWFEPLAERDPTGLRANVAFGLALVRSGEHERGMKYLRKSVENHPKRPEAWHALMAGLDEQGNVEELSKILETRTELSTEPWVAQFRGRVAEAAGNWSEAARAYQLASRDSPANSVLIYRHARTVRLEGKNEEANQLSERHRAQTALKQEARALYEKIANDPSSALTRYPSLYEEIAALREKMGYPEQAAAWRRVAANLSPVIAAPAGWK